MKADQEGLSVEYWTIALSLSAGLIGLVLPFSRLLGAALAVLWVAALVVVVSRSD